MNGFIAASALLSENDEHFNSSLISFFLGNLKQNTKIFQKSYHTAGLQSRQKDQYMWFLIRAHKTRPQKR